MRTGSITGTTAKAVMSGTAPRASTLARIFRLDRCYTSAAMHKGLATEQRTMELAIYNMARTVCPAAKNWILERPNMFRSDSPALCSSPDGVVRWDGVVGPDGEARRNPAKDMYMEAKSSATIRPDQAGKAFKHQMQLNMMLGGLTKGLVAFFDTSGGDKQPTTATVTQHCYSRDLQWQAEFKIKNQVFYETHLKWFHAEHFDQDRAKALVTVIADELPSGTLWTTA
jgi:hypothetical protein